ncbi:GvpL/GvpF family gas vesicle protein [Streptomyces sp. NPDC058417]|uniref:GvpL/GvpF family gas vesicle protein n=1 Tax=unclassified Streptomyces TaxID=2593676 RepID=UPI0036546B90
MSVYVYAVVDAGHRAALDGLSGVGDPPAALRVVDGRGLRAVVSDAPDGLRPKRRDLQAHQRVQESLMRAGAVLPLRFGLVAPDDAAVRQALAERAPQYTERLHSVRDCAEYNLKVRQEEEPLLRRILESSAEARGLNQDIRDGRAGPDAPVRLGEIVSAEVVARQQALAAGIVEALRPFSRELHTAQPTGEDFLNVSLLVPGEHEETFLTTEARVADQMGEDFEFRLNGPLPPYSFV